MNKADNGELKKAAILIAKLLLRTREGRIRWEVRNTPSLAPGIVRKASICSAGLEDGMEAIITEDERELGFVLSGVPFNSFFPAPPEIEAAIPPELVLNSHKAILSIALKHSYGDDETLSPESMVYRNLFELIQLAKNPKSVLDDSRYKQALSYLDKLTA